jgi:hypothetical protein
LSFPQYLPKGVRAPLTIAISPAFNMMISQNSTRNGPESLANFLV